MRMSAARRWLWFVAALSLIAADVPPWHIVAAIKDGNSLAISAKNFHIEVAAPSMIVQNAVPWIHAGWQQRLPSM